MLCKDSASSRPFHGSCGRAPCSNQTALTSCTTEIRYSTEPRNLSPCVISCSSIFYLVLIFNSIKQLITSNFYSKSKILATICRICNYCFYIISVLLFPLSCSFLSKACISSNNSSYDCSSLQVEPGELFKIHK